MKSALLAGRLLPVAVALGLTGCASVRFADQAGDIVTMPDAYPAAHASMTTSPQVCLALPDERAADLLASVGSGNTDLLAAAARLRRAQANARAAGASLWPSVQAGVNGSRGTGVFASSAGTGAAEPLTVYQGSVAASYEVDAWGRVSNERAAASLDAASAAASLQAIAITLNANAADTWFALVAQRQLVRLLEAQAATSRSFLELTRLRFGLGQAPAQDIGRQKQQLLEVERQLELARSGTMILETQLALLAGHAPGAFSPDTPETFPAVPAVPEPGLPAALADARPDVRAARLSLEAADRRTAIAVARRLPSLSLSANLTSIEQSLGDLFRDALWSAGIGTGVSLFDGGALSAGVDGAEADAQAELADYAGTLLRALQEVSSALIEIDSQDRIAANLDAQLDEADKVLGLTRDGYRQGQASYLDVLNALLSRQALARQRIDTRRQQFSSRIELCRALGQPVGDPVAATQLAVATEAQ